MLFPQYLIDCKGHLLDLSKPKIMGILNVTPDSFFDGNQYNQLDQALLHTERMLEEGADIIDVGGMSSRPGATIIPVEEELERVLPIIEGIVNRFPKAFISVDTVRSQVAKEAVQAGAHLVNDISAGSIDSKMYETVGELSVPYILMHMQGKPEDMQQNPNYKGGVVEEIQEMLAFEIGKLRSHGVYDIIIDPGFGFGKTVEDNYRLLNQLDLFKIFGTPVLVGLSRKSMIYKVTGGTPQTALNGTSALHMVALQKGARLLRVHDVKEAKEVVQLWSQLEEVVE